MLGDSDYLSIHDGPDLQSLPISKWDFNFHGHQKSFSSSGSHMLIQFVTDHEGTWPGFSAKYYHSPINPICKDWLNINTGFLTSPNHPTMDCSWVITASKGSTILIQFQVFEVK